MEERYHVTTQNRFYPDMSNVNKNITVETKLISPPTYIGNYRQVGSDLLKVLFILTTPIPVAVLSNEWVCGWSLAGIAGSNPAEAFMFTSCECCVLAGTGLCAD